MKRYYTYFPGCSSSDGGAKAYGMSTEAIAKALDMELIELEDWNCCGSTPYSGVDELASLCNSARNLALAEKKGFDIVTPCSSCYVILKRTNQYLKEYPRLKAKVDEALAAGGLEYHGTVKPRHLLDVLVNEIGYDEIKSKVKANLGELKVASYYGCQVVRPAPSFDHPEYPQSLDKLVESLGAKATPFPLKARCCGGSLIISEEDLALQSVNKLLENATSNGAELIVTVCPLCQTNLDVYQGKVNKKFKTKFKIPILFFTQLIGVAFGIDNKTLGIEKSIVPAEKVLAKSTKGEKGG
ncbi:MAG TPA: CoB--CoM heterodisulfide reductase iron-sulfur subunit B family protein [Dehalococcoidia bacterium]|nr:CoB--CoM heterodisulfide reductase iron-sulfur subunit B family protein [Dehalococcoidia bacterium]